MTIKVVEYVHEYDEADWEIGENGKREDYVSHITETRYAISADDTYTATNRDGSLNGTLLGGKNYAIDGSNLSVYGREDIKGLVGLLNKLLEEYPEDA